MHSTLQTIKKKSSGLISAVKMVVILLPIVGSSLHASRWTPNVSAVTSRGRVVETLKHKQQQRQWAESFMTPPLGGALRLRFPFSVFRQTSSWWQWNAPYTEEETTRTLQTLSASATTTAVTQRTTKACTVYVGGQGPCRRCRVYVEGAGCWSSVSPGRSHQGLEASSPQTGFPPQRRETPESLSG